MTRVTVPVGDDIGFLPGTEEEKMTPWMGALMDNLEVLTDSESGGEWGRAATSDLPPPDLCIRTGGDARISNFMLWQFAYSELYFTETLWPDFGELELARALQEYSRRERRFGLREPDGLVSGGDADA